jgi:3-dehydroquinate dehydratase-1
MGTVKLRGTLLGEGRPVVGIPIAAEEEDGIYAAAREIARLGAGLAEWRADHFARADEAGAVVRVIEGLHEILGDVPVLFTFRTAAEGGAADLAPEAYIALCGLAGRAADAVDVQMLTDEDTALKACEAVHRAGTPVFGSNHSFRGTPAREEMVRRLRRMQEMGADVLKLAVMPKNRFDVLALLEATLEMTERYADRPVVTMSMSPLGAVSRLAGEAFGSALTFGTAGPASAPGQIPAEALQTALDILHNAMAE